MIRSWRELSKSLYSFWCFDRSQVQGERQTRYTLGGAGSRVHTLGTLCAHLEGKHAGLLHDVQAVLVAVGEPVPRVLISGAKLLAEGATGEELVSVSVKRG